MSVAERDLAGYGGRPPHPRWPNDARLALQFVLNVEEGAERSILNGDEGSESNLHELPGRPSRTSERDPSIESMYAYGSRAGAWRILDLFAARDLPLTAFAAGQALERNPDLGRALAAQGHELAGHGYRWIDYHGVPEAEERRHIQLTCDIIEQFGGRRPVGWYTGRVSLNTHRLVREQEGMRYTSDAYDDDLPYWLPGSPPLLVIPYTLVNNDARYLWPTGFSSGQDFFNTLRDAFDLLWQEGTRHPKLMSVGLHGRISGHPARAMVLARFLDYVLDRDAVWVCRREEIAAHWAREHPAAG